MKYENRRTEQDREASSYSILLQGTARYDIQVFVDWQLYLTYFIAQDQVGPLKMTNT